MIVLDKERYKKIVQEVSYKPKKINNYLYAFLMGGFISSLGEFINLLIINNTNIAKEDSTIIVVLIFILLSALFTGFGLYDDLSQIFGAGLFIPITGFANAVCSEAIEYKSEGPIYGIGSNMFKLAGSVITYGVVTSIILSLIYALFI